MLSMLAIFLVIGLVGTGTFAWFQDTETSTGNTFTASTDCPDLKLRDPDQPSPGGSGWYDGVTATWTMSNMLPGDSTSGWILFTNFGDPASQLWINVSNETIDEPPQAESDTEKGSTTDMDLVMEITFMEYRNGGVTNCSDLITDLNGNEFKDLDDLENMNGGQGITVSPPFNGGLAMLEMTFKFHESADNDYQGDTLNSTFTFTLILE
jgi:predicted ribosomally synthesized peptide with SipW-like signal peptide